MKTAIVLEGQNMCNWRKWVLPCILATAVLTALAMLFHLGSIERDLAAKAAAALEQDHGWATATLDGRELTLSGIAPSAEAQNEATLLASAINDVRTVRDVSTLPPIQAPFVFEAQKGQGGIVLSGFAPSQAAREALLTATRTAHDGVTVTDQLQIARGAPVGFADLAGFGVTQLARLAEGDIKTDDEEFSIVGSAATPNDFTALNEALAGVLPGGGVLVANDVTAPLISPYQWSATRMSDGALMLDGFAPDSTTLASIMDAAAGIGAGGQVSNNLLIGAGAAEGFASAAELGLQALAGMTSGQAAIEAQSL
ncbi:MAG: BON domain-containing protein, partial [Pseudomonadota bacterium]